MSNEVARPSRPLLKRGIWRPGRCCYMWAHAVRPYRFMLMWFLMDAELIIFLVRHGETDWNANKRLQGWTDIPLNERGRQQAVELAQKFSGHSWNAVYCSTLLRSIQTAEAIVGSNRVIPLEGLREQSLGIYEGRSLLEEADLLPEIEKRLDNPDDSLDGGESPRVHFQRVEKTLRKIIADHSHGGQILIVGHGGTNVAIFRILKGEGFQTRPFRKPQDHLEIHRIVVRN